MDFITGTIISGIIYDILKAGMTITAKNIKDFFMEELHEITNEQARQIADQAKNTELMDIKTISRTEFIEKHKEIFNNESFSSIKSQQNIDKLMNSGTFINSSTETLQQNIYIPDMNAQKKS